MTKIEMIQTVVSGIVGIGTTKIAKQIIANNVEIDTPVDQVTVTAGSIVIGMMTAEATKSYSDAKIQEIADGIAKIKQSYQDQK